MTPKTSKQNLKHVVIVGGGFGGLRAARRLAKAPVCITLIDRNNYHLFQPLLYQVATAGVSPTDVAYPLRSIFRRQKNLVYQMAEVTRVDLNNRRLETTNGSLDYDYLILAVGGETNYFGLESVAVNAFGLKGLEDASPIRDH
ncbi:MAG TPA: FAD-dependent oxidoreductase, partial [Anaerolineaceae bacterium]|nr:FAD-dependent oxidoreductase [Anaerolineaceae bacterium]